MCKISSNDKKREQKKFQSRKVLIKKITLSDINETIKYNFNGLIDQTNSTPTNEDSSSAKEYPDDIQNILVSKREKSRIAAKKRRNLENDHLSELYISLPVATQSKLLTCYDDQFIGNFEKATIIKISAYVLNLYNSLSEVLFDSSFENHFQPLVSLFSQSIFGLFWCERTKKLVFSSPGLPRLTGLYWCNMIGLPQSTIIVESGNQDSSNLIFLRFMMGALKDRGIFTVNPQKSTSYKPSSEDVKTEKVPILNNQMKQDFLGKLPCSVWCSKKISNDISFSLIQPLIVKSEISSIRNQVVQSYQFCPYRLPIFDSIRYYNKKHTPHKFISYHNLESLATISLCGDVQISLGYKEEDFSKSSFLSFFHCDDIVQVARQLNELLSGQKKIQMGIARLCTPKIETYRWSRYVLQISSIKNITESSFKTNRSSQGESYSQSFVRISNTLNNSTGDYKGLGNDFENFWLEATFSLLHYFQECHRNYASLEQNEVFELNKECVCSKCETDVKNNLLPSSNNSLEETKWFNVPPDPIGSSVDFRNTRQIFYNDTNTISYYPQNYRRQDAVLYCC